MMEFVMQMLTFIFKTICKYVTEQGEKIFTKAATVGVP